MKMTIQRIIIQLICITAASEISAQKDQPKAQGCSVSSYQVSIDSLKNVYARQGYSIVREASMSMESQSETPIVVPMTQGTWYQFVFIGDPGGRFYEVRMFDRSEKEVVYKKNLWGELDGNIISCNYIPKTTEYHMIKPLQVNQNKKSLCGYVLLLKKVANQPASAGN